MLLFLLGMTPIVVIEASPYRYLSYCDMDAS
jgi:hypothetical protein